LKRVLPVFISGIAALALIVATLFAFRSGHRPLCHRALDGAIHQWMLEAGHANVYPNANGIGSNSLTMLEPYFRNDIQRYGYIPGLSYDDLLNQSPTMQAAEHLGFSIQKDGVLAPMTTPYFCLSFLSRRL
jgi:hypothetical protein